MCVCEERGVCVCVCVCVCVWCVCVCVCVCVCTEVYIQHGGIGTFYDDLLLVTNGLVEIEHCVLYHGLDDPGMVLGEERERGEREGEKREGEKGQREGEKERREGRSCT